MCIYIYIHMCVNIYMCVYIYNMIQATYPRSPGQPACPAASPGCPEGSRAPRCLPGSPGGMVSSPFFLVWDVAGPATFGYLLRGFQKSVQVPLSCIEAAMVLTVIILK